MSKRIFTTEQLKELRKNKNVKKCSKKSVTYSSDFKILAVTRYETEGLTSAHIFKEAGFDLETIGRDTPSRQMCLWRKIEKTKGIEALTKESRGRNGGRPKTKGLTDKDKIKKLEATNAYLKAENDFLAKLRAGRRE